jgi:CheY-like chemotaxis protein
MKSILVVEDNEMNRDVLSRRLMRRGFRVLVASDGHSGIEIARAEQPHLILMDLAMPNVDGWECARRLKGEESTRSIPIIALSAHAMLGERQKALAAGCDDFDTKPVDFQALLEKMDRLLYEAECTRP